MPVRHGKLNVRVRVDGKLLTSGPTLARLGAAERRDLAERGGPRIVGVGGRSAASIVSVVSRGGSTGCQLALRRRAAP